MMSNVALITLKIDLLYDRDKLTARVLIKRSVRICLITARICELLKIKRTIVFAKLLTKWAQWLLLKQAEMKLAELKLMW